MIGIIDYGCGNIRSLTNALIELDIEHKLIKSVDHFNDCDKIIIPGVGSYFNAIKKIREKGFETKIKEFVISNKKVLGICLGMQILSEFGNEEGRCTGLDLIKVMLN